MDYPPLDDLFSEFKLPGPILPGDKLFSQQEDDWWNNARLNWSSAQWDLYAAGYKEAADRLVADIEKRECGQDSLVYPILFLYRQYIELLVKDTLRAARKVLDIAEPVPASHRIFELWQALHKLLLEISPGDSVQELKQVARIIKDFSNVDPQSMAFRYPVDKNGGPSLPGISRINLRNVREVMEKVSRMLEGANTVVYERLQFKIEQERLC